MIPLAVADFFKASDGVGQRGDFSSFAGEDFGDQERLGQEAFDTSSATHDCLVFLAQFVNPENRDDVLEFAIPLEGALNASCDVVMPLTDNRWIENPRVGGQWIDRRVNPFFGDGSLEVDKRIELSESGRSP